MQALYENNAVHRGEYEHDAETYTAPPQLGTQITNCTCEENTNKPDNADTRIRTSTSTVKRQSHNNNKRHRCFHRSSYEAIFCGRKSRISATPPHAGTEVHHPITSAFYPHSDPEPLWRVQEQGCTDTERRRKHRHNNRRLDIEKYAKLHHNYSSHNQQ